MSLATLFDFFFLTIKKKSKKKLAQNRHSVTNKIEIQKEINLSTEKRTSGCARARRRQFLDKLLRMQQTARGRTRLPEPFLNCPRSRAFDEPCTALRTCERTVSWRTKRSASAAAVDSFGDSLSHREESEAEVRVDNERGGGSTCTLTHSLTRAANYRAT